MLESLTYCKKSLTYITARGMMTLEKVHPADGCSNSVKGLTAKLVAGRLILFLCLEQCKDAYDKNSNLDQIGICDHERLPLSISRGNRNPPAGEQPSTDCMNLV